MTRRASLFAGIIVLMLAPLTGRAQGAQKGMQRVFATDRVSMEVEGFAVGYLRGVDGGNPIGMVTTGPAGPDGIPGKHIAAVGYDDIIAVVGMGMGKGMYDWISGSLNGAQAPRKNGRILVGDFNYKAQSEQLFNNAFISAVTIPALDGSSKDAAYFTVQITPGTVAFRKGSGAEMRGKIGPKQKAWLSSNFRFELAGLPTNRVASIDSFTISRKVMQTAPGATRELSKVPSSLEFPNLVLTISAADQAQWEQWRDSFLIQGNHTDADEKAGAIVFLAPDMKNELGRVSLDHCGLVRLAPNAGDAGAVSRFTVELYCQKMAFTLNDYDA
ncbi:MAG TPA: hypothetical protein VF761_08040 [Gemmatimonadaceae bacterium]